MMHGDDVIEKRRHPAGLNDLEVHQRFLHVAERTRAKMLVKPETSVNDTAMYSHRRSEEGPRRVTEAGAGVRKELTAESFERLGHDIRREVHSAPDRVRIPCKQGAGHARDPLPRHEHIIVCKQDRATMRMR